MKIKQKFENRKKRIAVESQELRSCFSALMKENDVIYQLEEIDLSHDESIWYQAAVKTHAQSGLNLCLHFFRDALGIQCNDYQMLIYISEKPMEFREWMEHFPRLISALFQPELRIRGRRSLFGGKTAAVWLELPDGGKWLGDKKACRGTGKEFVFKDWLAAAQIPD